MRLKRICTECHLSFKSIYQLTKHQEKIGCWKSIVTCMYCYQDLLDFDLYQEHLKTDPKCAEIRKKFQFKFQKLPWELQLECMNWISPKDCLFLFSLGVDLFSSEFNFYWKKRFQKEIKLPAHRPLKPVSWGLAYLACKNFLCICCMKETSHLHPFYGVGLFGVRVCPICTIMNKTFTWMPEHNIKNGYAITKKDLDKLECAYIEDPYSINPMPVRIYLESDVIKLGYKDITFRGK